MLIQSQQTGQNVRFRKICYLQSFNVTSRDKLLNNQLSKTPYEKNLNRIYLKFTKYFKILKNTDMDYRTRISNMVYQVLIPPRH